VSARRTERLLNLVICLLASRSFLTAERIRETVPGYDETPSDEAFKRAFERDKEDLRDLGIPLETGTNSAFDDEPGYRIARGDYALPPLTFEPDEAAAVGLAARMWTTAAMGAAATRALRKLEAAGAEMVALPEGLQPRVEATGVAFPALAAAVHEGRVVTFDYRTGASTGEPARRTVEPWGLVVRRGRWYLVGHDRDRADTRVFRLSRVAGTPRAVGPAGAVTRPAGLDLSGAVASYDAQTPSATAVLRVRTGRGLGLRRLATDASAGDSVPGGGGWDRIRIPYGDAERLADAILPYGADVVIEEPSDAVAVVVARLRALAEVGA
jgi:predicted DNA-binding transcriptional regulator YafY